VAPRANWKGYLRLSLVPCPIALYPASSLSEKVSFNRINRKTGNRLKQQNVDSETGEVVPREDAARGYEVGKGQLSKLRARGPSRSISSFQETRLMIAIGDVSGIPMKSAMNSHTLRTSPSSNCPRT
jgi:Ku70/Ku80 beta-barrel domain